MKKIMFNNKYELTEAVLSGRKTQTRRIVPQSVINKYSMLEDFTIIDEARYNIGEVVAVAQSYKDAGVEFIPEEDEELGCCHNFPAELTPGWTNKMFVRADLMPLQIRITDVRVERLQDISDEDCIKEGVEKVAECDNLYRVLIFHKSGRITDLLGKTPREAYAALIDKISGKGTWQNNPYVFAYEFELVK